MRSKNKPAQTAQEKRHVFKLAALPCVVCGTYAGSEIHEPKQGYWYIAIPLCPDCHRGPDGWHGTRLRWKLRKYDELRAINETLRQVLL